jgi:hypothetical protein
MSLLTTLPHVRRAGAAALVAAALLLALPSTPDAHEIPARVVVQAFVKPDGDRLRLLVRVPLTSMRDVIFPLRDGVSVDIRATEPMLHEQATTWIAHYVEMFEGDSVLGLPVVAATRISLPSDPSFASYETALAHVRGTPLAPDTELPLEQAMLDVLLEYPIRSAGSRFAIRPELAHLGVRTTTVLRFLPPDGAERVLQYTGHPGLVRLDPGWHQAALRFIALGFQHILAGLDHLLFLVCLVIPVRRLWSLVAVVTSFTVAHSITLIASALGLAPSALWFPPLIETLIALSIVYMALENIAGAKLERRWLMAFGFGLVHGFGFSFFLRESLQFAGSHLITSLLAFNVGVELGQLFVLAIAVPALAAVFRWVVAERIGTIILSALVAHTAWHWMTGRGAELLQYDFVWPALDAALIASAMRWLMLLLILSGALWLLFEIVERTSRPRREGEPAPGAGDGVT